MRISRLQNSIRFYWQFIPFRANFILYILLVMAAWRWVHHTPTEGNSFRGMILLMARIALYTSQALVCCCLLSALFCYLHFLWGRRKHHEHAFRIGADLADRDEHILRLQTQMPFALKPLLGFVKARLRYDRHLFTEAYLMTGRLKKQLLPFRTGLESNNRLLLPDIKEYHFSGAIVYFEDMLRFFSFACFTKLNNSLINLPHPITKGQDEALPKKTEEQLVRIDQLRRVAGEYLNYKKFEDADDVRRIVWKIFARNRELMVRIPETVDPFASHVDLYASFYNGQVQMMDSDFCREMLNHFKNCTWTIYDALCRQELDVRFIPDQSVTVAVEQSNAVQEFIARCQWHHDRSVDTYFKHKTASVLLVHSFTPAHELEQVLERCDAHTHVFFVQLSRVLKSPYLLNWILRIFLKPGPDRLNRLRNRWALHPFKFQTLHNEKNLLSLIRNSTVQLIII